MLRKLALTLALLLALQLSLAPQAAAQSDYNFGIGLKIGSPLGGITGKLFFTDRSAVELLVQGGSYGVGVTALYEYNVPFAANPSLHWYFGGGGHFAMGRENVYNPYADGYYSTFCIGVDGVLGLEYVFENYPFSIGVDAIPLINLNDGFSAWWNAGIYGRYVFK